MATGTNHGVRSHELLELNWEQDKFLLGNVLEFGLGFEIEEGKHECLPLSISTYYCDRLLFLSSVGFFLCCYFFFLLLAYSSEYLSFIA